MSDQPDASKEGGTGPSAPMPSQSVADSVTSKNGGAGLSTPGSGTPPTQPTNPLAATGGTDASKPNEPKAIPVAGRTDGPLKPTTRSWQIVQAIAAICSAVAACASAYSAWLAREQSAQFQSEQRHRDGADTPLEVQLRWTPQPLSIAIENVSRVAAVDIRVLASVAYFSGAQRRYLGARAPSIQRSLQINHIAPYSTHVLNLESELRKETLDWERACASEGCHLVLIVRMFAKHPSTGMQSTDSEVFVLKDDQHLESSSWGSHFTADGGLVFEMPWSAITPGLPELWNDVTYEYSGELGDHRGPFNGVGIEKAARLVPSLQDNVSPADAG